MTVQVPWYGHLIEEVSARHGLPADLVGAMVRVESSGRTNAYRYEPAYWLRYLADKPEWRDLNPNRVSASYGLLQVMYPTAVANGYVGDPEALFLPAMGLEFGCRELERLLAWARTFEATPEARLQAAVAAYNGGQRGNAPTDTPLRNLAYTGRVAHELSGIPFAALSG